MNRCQEDLQRRRKAVKTRTALRESVDGLERRIEFLPGYDHREFPELCGGGGHGQHGIDMTWILIGPSGAVQWKVFLSDLVPGNVTNIGDVPGRSGVMAADLGYHSPTPMYEGQDDIGPCDLLGIEKCYYDGSGLNAAPILDQFMWQGPSAVWSALENYYNEQFGEKADES